MVNLMELDNKISEIIERTIQIRRHIHENPELSYEEEQTARLVADELRSYGIDVQEGVGGHGVAGLISGNRSGKTLLLRADMDALPVQEETGLPFSSKVPGKMHACGHDLHTAIMLGVANILSQYKDLPGNVKFMFQPAEEANPRGGAQGMIEAGILENPKVDYALALHVWPDLSVGEIGLVSGPVSAQSDRVFIKVLGKAGHASAPHQGIDALVAAAQIVSSLQSIVSRRVSPRDSIVITLGKIAGGQRYNILCDTVDLEGTVRIMTPGYEDTIPKLINQVGQGVASAYGAQLEIKYTKGYPMVINDDRLTAVLEKHFTEKLGKNAVKIIGQDTSGEDFSFIARKVPSVYMKLGSSPQGSKEFVPLHNSKVIFDESCIPFGIKAMILSTLKLLDE